MYYSKKLLRKLSITSALLLTATTSLQNIINAEQSDNQDNVIERSDSTKPQTTKEAREKINKLKEDLTQITQQIDELKEELNNKQLQLSTSNDTLKTLEQDLENKSQEVNQVIEKIKSDAQVALDQAVTEKSDAELNVSTLQNRLDELQKSIEKAQNDYDNLLAQNPDLKDRLKEKEVALNQAQDEKDNAQTDLNDKKAFEQTKQANYDEKVRELADATQNKENAQLEKNQAQELVNTKTHEHEVAVNEKNNAQQTLDAYQNTIQEVSQKLDEAKQVLDNLNQQKSEKQEEIDFQKNQQQAFENTKAQQQEALNVAEGNYTNEKATLEQLKQEKSSKESDYNNKKQATQEAKTALATAELEKTNQQNAVNDKTQEKTNLEQTIPSKEEELNQLKEKLNADKLAWENSKVEAQNQIAKGSKGFFETMNSELALKVLKNTQTGANGTLMTSHTQMGNAQDATSLDNMIKAIQYVKQGNVFRTAGDNNFTATNELRLTDELMAVAQLNANYSKTYSDGHSRYLGPFPRAAGENLAWGGDPYNGWYTAEKAFYDHNGGSVTYGDNKTYRYDNWLLNTTGHYEHIMDQKFAYTGYGFASGTSTSAQVFWDITRDTSYTADEYLARLENYYNPLKEKATNGDSTLKSTYETTKQDVESKQQELEQLKNRLATVTTELSQENTQLSEKEQAVVLAQNDVQTKEQEESAAQVELTNATQAVSAQENMVTAKEEVVTNARQTLNTTQLQLDGILQAVSQKEAELNALNAQIDQAKEKLDQAEIAFGESDRQLTNLQDTVAQTLEVERLAQEALTQAIDDNNNKEQLLQNAQNNLTAATTAVENAQNDLTVATTAVENAQQQLDVATRNVEQAQSEFNQIKVENSEISAQKDLVDSLRTEQLKVQEDIQKATDNLSVLEAKIQDRVEALNKAQTIDRNDIDTYRGYSEVVDAIDAMNRKMIEKDEQVQISNNLNQTITTLQELLNRNEIEASRVQAEVALAQDYLEQNFKASVYVYPEGGVWSDGSTEPKEITGYLGDSITVPNAPTREGYKFLYWEGSKYYLGDTYVFNDKSHQLKAVWEVVENTEEKNKTNDVKTNSTLKQTAKEKKVLNKKLPQTGDNTHTLTSLIGLGLIGTAFISRRKRN